MRKRFLKQTVKCTAAIMVTTLCMSVFTACGKSSDNNRETDKTKKIVIGSGINYMPYAYLDDHGKAVGYDYDVLQAIDDYLDEYVFQYDSMSFDNILLSLDANKIDVAAHEYEYTDERAKKYLFSEEYYSEFITRIAVSTDNDDIQSIDDLAGKKVNAGGATSASYSILSQWNEEHPGKEIQLITTESEVDETSATNIKNGVWDALILEQKDIIRMNENFGNGKDFLKFVGEPINESHGYFLFHKEDTELQKAFDEAIKALKANGKLDEISEKWLSESE